MSKAVCSHIYTQAENLNDLGPILEVQKLSKTNEVETKARKRIFWIHDNIR